MHINAESECVADKTLNEIASKMRSIAQQKLEFRWIRNIRPLLSIRRCAFNVHARCLAWMNERKTKLNGICELWPVAIHVYRCNADVLIGAIGHNPNTKGYRENGIIYYYRFEQRQNISLWTFFTGSMVFLLLRFVFSPTQKWVKNYTKNILGRYCISRHWADQVKGKRNLEIISEQNGLEKSEQREKQEAKRNGDTIMTPYWYSTSCCAHNLKRLYYNKFTGDLFIC